MSERKNAPVLVFTAGGRRLGVFIAEVGRLLLEGTITPIPFSHPAMAGLLDDPEVAPFPVFDLSGLVGGGPPAPHVVGARVALFTTERGPVGLRMDTMEGTRSDYTFLTDSARADAHTAELPGPLRATVTAVGELPGGGAFFFFSPDAFLARLDLGAAGRPESLS